MSSELISTFNLITFEYTAVKYNYKSTSVDQVPCDKINSHRSLDQVRPVRRIGRNIREDIYQHLECGN